MSDTAAFFANKKKKKKAPFKFNANLIDANSVLATEKVHVDAPALSTDVSAGGLSSAVAGLGLAGEADRAAAQLNNDEQWDDAAVVAVSSSATSTAARKPASATSGGDAHVGASAGILDYKSLAPKRGAGSDNIAEKLRLEETKAQLAAAREGMEREAQKLKEEKERKAQAAASKASASGGSGGGIGGGLSAGGSRWLPPHLRAGGAGTMSAPAGTSRFGAAAAMGGKIDVQSEELFPDLASADKILEQQKEKEQHSAFRIPKKTPVGGGATWASKPRLPAAAAAPAPSKREPAPQSAPSEPAQRDSPARNPDPEPQPDVSEIEPPVVTAASTDVAAPKSPPKIAPKKKNKKDLSTFKPGG